MPAMVHASPLLRPRAASAAVFTACLVSAALAGSAREASAQRKVHLNGVNLADVEVKSLSLDNCGVKFDAAGDVFITCKGVDIKTAPTKAKRVEDDAPRSSGRLSKRYFLVAKPTRKGRAAPFKVSVYLNDKQVALVEPAEELYFLEVTEHLRPGDNAVRLVAARDARGAKRRSPNDQLELIIGEGVVRKGTVLIQRPLVVYRRNGAETRSFDDRYELRAR